MVGLLLITWLVARRNLKFPLALTAALAGWYVLPFAIVPRALLLAAHETWSATFSKFVQEAFLNFENIFAFFNAAFNAQIPFVLSQLISLLVGVLLAATTGLWLVREKDPEERLKGGTLPPLDEKHGEVGQDQEPHDPGRALSGNGVADGDHRGALTSGC